MQAVREDMLLVDIKEFVYQRKFNSFPVVDASGKLKGILSLSDCQEALEKGDMSVTALDIATRKVVYVTGEEAILAALNKITSGDFAILPVVDSKDSMKLLGVISRRDIISAFNEYFMKRMH